MCNTLTIALGFVSAFEDSSFALAYVLRILVFFWGAYFCAGLRVGGFFVLRDDRNSRIVV